MKTNANAWMFAMVFAVTLQNINAQTSYVNQVFFLNEGSYDFTNQVQVVPVTLGVYKPGSDSYSVFDTIPEIRWGTALEVDENYLYAAGDSTIIVYDKNTLKRLKSATIIGFQKMAIWKNHIVVSRGSYQDVYSANVQVYDKSTLGLLYQLDTVSGPMYATSGDVVISGDTAYIAVNNGFGWPYTGIIGIVDLATQLYKGEVDLGSDGINPDNFMLDGGTLYTLNNKNWDSTGSSISVYHIADRSHQTYNMAGSVGGCGASVSAADFVYYQRYSSTDSLSRFSKTSFSVDALAENFPGFLYGMVTDTINNRLYVTTTDYATWGKAYILLLNGTVIDSFDVGISAGNIGLDIRQVSGVNQTVVTNNFRIYPNPVSDYLYLAANSVDNSFRWELKDVTGRVLLSKRHDNGKHSGKVDMRAIKPGIYLLVTETGSGDNAFVIVKM